MRACCSCSGSPSSPVPARPCSPCVLPVLPAVLSAGGAGGRRRPLGVVLGLTVTFTVTIVGIAEVVGGVGLGTDPLRALAVVVLAGFGIALLFPSVAARLEAPLARLSRFGPRTRGDGFASGLLVGAALGFVYTPCAGPILAAVITVSAATGRSVAVALAYAVGSAAVLLALCLGGRRVARPRPRGRPRRRAPAGASGAVMLATALAHRHERRRELRPVRRAADPRGQPDRVARALGRGARSACTRSTPASRSSPSRCRPACRRTRTAPCRSSAWRPSSRTPSAGSTPPAAGRRRSRRCAARRGPRRLLDLHVHQLPAHAALPRGVGPPLPRRGADDRRRAHARVRLRARRGQRRERDQAPRHPLPGRPGQRDGHLERLRRTCTGRPTT